MKTSLSCVLQCCRRSALLLPALTSCWLPRCCGWRLEAAADSAVFSDWLALPSCSRLD
jgi:hypothetical protein